MQTATRRPTVATPGLGITVDGRSYTIAPAEAPITLGREFPSQILLGDPRISRVHLRVEVVAGNWVGVDLSSNGCFVRGHRQASFPIEAGMTVHLGNPDGIPVAFNFTSTDTSTNPAPAADDDDIDDTHVSATVDPDIARAGAAVAARRTELDLSRRLLARDGIINAGTLGGLEKGVHWPKPSTLRKLEEALGWAPGTIADIRYGRSSADPAATTVALTSTVQVSHMAAATSIALDALRGRIAALPDTNSPEFATTAAAILDELRRLERITGEAARGTVGAAEITLALGAVRSTYRDLMLTAARSPHATLGQRLFAARHSAQLTEAEAAGAAGLPVEVITAAEAGEALTAEQVSAIQGLLAAMGGR